MSSHDISHLNTRMAGRPRLLPVLESNAGSKPRRQRIHGRGPKLMPTRCCWPRFQFAPFVGRNLLRPFPSRHFDPFGTELLSSRGGSTIRFTKILRAFVATPIYRV